MVLILLRPPHAKHTSAFQDVHTSVMAYDRRELAAVFVGGALGTLARAGLETLAAPDPGRWPWVTFVVNIVGAFLLGYFTTRLLERLPLSSYRRPLLGTGLCGGLTTFADSFPHADTVHLSTFAREMLSFPSVTIRFLRSSL